MNRKIQPPSRHRQKRTMSSTDRKVFRRVLFWLYAASLAFLFFLLVRGWTFYITPLSARIDHEGYWQWKPGGSVGVRLGIAGSVMMTLMLLYSVRKRVKLLRRLGPLSNWLDLHIFLGIIGPFCIVLHSSFKFQGLVSLSFWSMIVVMMSGVLGRYLYLQIPRTREGEELTLSELEELDRSLSERLRSLFHVGEQQLARLEDAVSRDAARRGLVRDLLSLITSDLRRRSRLRDFVRSNPQVPRALVGEFERVARQKARVHARIRFWSRLHELFHYWHVVHKPFAAVMYLFMILHVIVATLTGYGV